MLSWIVLSLIAATGWAVVVLLDKVVVDTDVQNAAASGHLHAMFNSATIAAAALILDDVALDASLAVDGFIIASLYVAANYFWFEGVGTEDVSRFAPVLSLDVVFVAIFAAIFVGEQHGLLTYSGISITVLGCILISLDKPLSKQLGLKSRLGFFAAMASALIYAIRETYFKHAAAEDTWGLLFYFGVMGAVLAGCLAATTEPDRDIRGKTRLLISGIISGLSLTLFYLAVSNGPVSLVTTITKSRFVLIFLGATLASKLLPGVLHEPLKKPVLAQKIVATAMIIAGSIIAAMT
jgi:uncharacterized membrane protein